MIPFTHCVTAKNAQGTIGTCVLSLTRDPDARVVIVDASEPPMALGLPGQPLHLPQVRVEWMPGCAKGAGRNRAVYLAETPIVFTHIDADNHYRTNRWPMFEKAAQHLGRAPLHTLLIGVGLHDKNPGATHFFGWYRDAFLQIGGYPDRQLQDDLLLILKVFRAGWRVQRVVFPAIADDLQERAPGSAGQTERMASRAHFAKAIRKQRHLGFTYGECVRFQWVTRRTLPRFAAAVGIVTWIYITRRQNPNEYLTTLDADAAGLT
jgi:hypothetical protein